MKIKCISKEILQDVKNPKQYYFTGKEYEVSEERGKELVKTGKFVEVDNPIKNDRVEDKPKKKTKKDN